MKIVLLLFLSLATSGCTGVWMGQRRPAQQALADRYPRDVRVTLIDDNIVVLQRAVIQGDSLVESANGDSATPSTAVALADIQRLEVWQSGGERTAGAVILGTLGTVAMLVYLFIQAIPAT
jgi:hypothetical protein